MVIEELDLYPRSVRSGARIPIARSHGSFPPVQSTGHGVLAEESSMQWIVGGIQIELRGHGGKEGGELRIRGDGVVSLLRLCSLVKKLIRRPAISLTAYLRFRT